MTHAHRRALRAITSLTLSAAASTLALVPISASAAGDTTTTARVVGRTLTVDGTRDDDIIWLASSDDDPASIVVATGLEFQPVATIRRGRLDRIIVHGGAGNDTILVDDSPGSPFTESLHITIHGDGGHDFLQGGQSDDVLDGGAGFDTIDGRRGDDTISGGAGDDHVLWIATDGSDHIDGGTGNDTASLTGDSDQDAFVLSPDGPRAQVVHNGATSAATIDIRRTETVNLNTLEGSDTTDIGDLSRTPIRTVSVDDGAIPGGDTPDDSTDTVRVVGTHHRDHIDVTGDGGLTQITGMPTAIQLIDLSTADVVEITVATHDTVDSTHYATDAARVELIVS